MKIKGIFAVVFITVLHLVTQAQDENKLTISGYSDLTFTSPWGAAASEEDLEKFETEGGDEELTESTAKVNIPGFNLIFTRPISEKFRFQGELVNSMEDGELELELLRCYVDYSFNPKFNLQAGKFLSAIGYLNRNQRFYGYLNYSVQHRRMVEKEFGYIPLTTVGLKAYGSFSTSSLSSINYQIAFGGMREATPEASSELLSGFEIGEDESNSPGVSVLAEYLAFIGNTELTLGMSGYMVSRIVGYKLADGEHVAYGHDADELEEEGLLVRDPMQLKEFGVAPYLRLDAQKFQFLGELHHTVFQDEEGNLPSDKFQYTAFSLELVYKSTLAGKSFYPYVRFDSEQIAGGGYHPFYGLTSEDNELENYYMPSSQELIFGFAWDVIRNNRIKLEYGRFLYGPYTSNNLKMSTAFAF